MTYLGIDLGGTKVALRLETDVGGPGTEAAFHWPGQDVQQDVRALREAVDQLLRESPDGGSAVRAVGLALPATVARGRIIAWPSRPSWCGLELSSLLGPALPGVPVRHADDGNLAALAEAATCDCPDLAYLGVGTGVGGGAVLGGRLLTGPSGSAGEIGHMVIDRRGPRCACGRTGCLQAIASGPATLTRAAAARGDGPVTPAAFVTGLADHHDWARRALAETADALAVAVVNLGELLECVQVRIGGGFGSGVPGLVSMISQRVAALARPGRRTPQVLRAVRGARASLWGALLLARRSIGDELIGNP